MATTITGDAELKRKLSKLKDLSQLYPALFAAGVHVKGKVSIYPPSGPGNMPRTVAGSGRVLPWYDRGYGTRWIRKDGSEGGNPTSEDLGPSWTATGDQGTRVIIGNDTSYGQWVQGAGTQSAAMDKIGWKTTDEVVDEENATVLGLIKKEVDKILASG